MGQANSRKHGRVARVVAGLTRVSGFHLCSLGEQEAVNGKTHKSQFRHLSSGHLSSLHGSSCDCC